jgi:hypothetical protein
MGNLPTEEESFRTFLRKLVKKVRRPQSKGHMHSIVRRGCGLDRRGEYDEALRFLLNENFLVLENARYSVSVRAISDFLDEDLSGASQDDEVESGDHSDEDSSSDNLVAQQQKLLILTPLESATYSYLFVMSDTDKQKRRIGIGSDEREEIVEGLEGVVADDVLDVLDKMVTAGLVSVCGPGCEGKTVYSVRFDPEYLHDIDVEKRARVGEMPESGIWEDPDGAVWKFSNQDGRIWYSTSGCVFPVVDGFLHMEVVQRKHSVTSQPEPQPPLMLRVILITTDEAEVLWQIAEGHYRKERLVLPMMIKRIHRDRDCPLIDKFADEQGVVWRFCLENMKAVSYSEQHTLGLSKGGNGRVSEKPLDPSRDSNEWFAELRALVMHMRERSRLLDGVGGDSAKRTVPKPISTSKPKPKPKPKHELTVLSVTPADAKILLDIAEGRRKTGLKHLAFVILQHIRNNSVYVNKGTRGPGAHMAPNEKVICRYGFSHRSDMERRAPRTSVQEWPKERESDAWLKDLRRISCQPEAAPPDPAIKTDRRTPPPPAPAPSICDELPPEADDVAPDQQVFHLPPGVKGVMIELDEPLPDSATVEIEDQTDEQLDQDEAGMRAMINVAQGRLDCILAEKKARIARRREARRLELEKKQKVLQQELEALRLELEGL